MRLSVCLCLLWLVSCSSVKLSRKGSQVKTRRPYVGHCKKLAVVQGKGKDIAAVEIDARNKAGELGANYIDLDIPRLRYIQMMAKGVAYRCSGEY